jgi:hypothetical protein
MNSKTKQTLENLPFLELIEIQRSLLDMVNRQIELSNFGNKLIEKIEDKEHEDIKSIEKDLSFHNSDIGQLQDVALIIDEIVGNKIMTLIGFHASFEDYFIFVHKSRENMMRIFERHNPNNKDNDSKVRSLKIE